MSDKNTLLEKQQELYEKSNESNNKVYNLQQEVYLDIYNVEMDVCYTMLLYIAGCHAPTRKW